MYSPPQEGPRWWRIKWPDRQHEKNSLRKKANKQEIIDEEKERHRAKNGSLWNTSTDSKGTTFVILKNHACTPIRKERLSPTSKARKEASRKRAGCQTERKAFVKSTVARIVREPGLGLLNPSEID